MFLLHDWCGVFFMSRRYIADSNGKEYGESGEVGIEQM